MDRITTVQLNALRDNINEKLAGNTVSGKPLRVTWTAPYNGMPNGRAEINGIDIVRGSKRELWDGLQAFRKGLNLGVMISKIKDPANLHSM